MGNKNIQKSNQDKNSNSSVLNYSLESNKVSTPDSLIIYNNNNDNDIIKELKDVVDLPIENEYEYIESPEFLLEGKEEELKIKNLFENNDNFLDNGIINKKRSKTFMPQILIKNAPRPKPLQSYEYISPLKLSIKSYGQKLNRMPNAVLYDFQKNNIDSKSCNDEDNFDDFYLLDSDTERTTPNPEDLQNLLNCRKKMTIFRNSINERNIKEYENILNSDYLFNENNNEINININNYQSKKNFWCKHIKQQLLKDKNKGALHTKRIASVPLVKRCENTSCEEEEEEEEEEDKKDHGLFILGILESAANERKKRNNTVVLNSDYNQL